MLSSGIILRKSSEVSRVLWQISYPTEIFREKICKTYLFRSNIQHNSVSLFHTWFLYFYFGDYQSSTFLFCKYFDKSQLFCEYFTSNFRLNRNSMIQGLHVKSALFLQSSLLQVVLHIYFSMFFFRGYEETSQRSLNGFPQPFHNSFIFLYFFLRLFLYQMLPEFY